MANGNRWNPNTRMYETIDFDRQLDIHYCTNSKKNLNSKTMDEFLINKMELLNRKSRGHTIGNALFHLKGNSMSKLEKEKLERLCKQAINNDNWDKVFMQVG